MKTTPAFIVALLGASLIGEAAEFPLEYKRLSFAEAQACPGGYGMSGPIQKSLRGQVKSEPKPTSTVATTISSSSSWSLKVATPSSRSFPRKERGTC